jgi:hypothetical protein
VHHDWQQGPIDPQSFQCFEDAGGEGFALFLELVEQYIHEGHV